MITRNCILCVLGTLVLSFVLFPCSNQSFAQIEQFQPAQGEVIEVWRITNDPTVRDHANYHNTQCWSEDGRTIYVTCYGGRQPQGLWAVDVDGSNERCIISGPCNGHGTANPEEDRFVIDDLYNDCKTGLWMAKKGSTEPDLLCQTGVSWEGERQEYHPHPRFLPDGKTVAFSSAMSGSGEVYLVEV